MKCTSTINIIPTKHLCILVPVPFFLYLVPYLHQFSAVNIYFSLKEGTVRVPLPFSRNRPVNHSHNLGKALSEGLCLLCARFTLSIPFTSLSLHFSLSLSLYYLSLSLYISPSTFLSLSLLSIILFGVINGRFRTCLQINSVLGGLQ